MPLALPILVQADGYVFMVIGLVSILLPHMPAQAMFFLGSSVPYPLPWAAAPFEGFMTQKGLQGQWDTVTLACRALGFVQTLPAFLSLLFGLSMLFAGRNMLSHFRIHEEYLLKKGKRGEAVHSKVERYEQQTGAVREVYSPPPLLLAVLVHVACAAAPLYLRAQKPPLALLGGFELTEWFTTLTSALHAFGALAILVAWAQARSIWGGRRATAADGNALKAE